MSDTAVILIDPYNEFLHPDGKLNHKIATSLRDMDTIKHLKDLVTAARANKIPIYYGFHQQTNAHSWDGWKHATKAQGESRANRVFEAGSFGAQIYEGLEPSVENGDVVVSKHWSWSSFENTDLEFQLRQREIKHLVFAGLEQSACVESTARVAYERGYTITMLKDATAAFNEGAASESIEKWVWPLFAQDVMSTEDWVKSLEK